MSAIDPSLLFSQQQQQQRLQQQQGEANQSEHTGRSVNGQGKGVHDDEASDSGMALDDEAGKPTGAMENDGLAELDGDDAEPLNLKDDAILAAFLAKMDDYEPILPNAVTRYYLERSGFQSADDRVCATTQACSRFGHHR